MIDKVLIIQILRKIPTNWAKVTTEKLIYENLNRETWLVHSVEHATFDLGVMSSSPTLSQELTFKKKEFKKKLEKKKKPVKYT